MSWKITMTVADSQLQSTLKSLGKRKVEVEWETPNEPTEAKPKNGESRKTVTGDAVISMGPTIANKGTQFELVQAMLAKLEKQHGPWNVTRAQLVEAIKKSKNISEHTWMSGISTMLSKKMLEAK